MLLSEYDTNIIHKSLQPKNAIIINLVITLSLFMEKHGDYQLSEISRAIETVHKCEKFLSYKDRHRRIYLYLSDPQNHVKYIQLIVGP